MEYDNWLMRRALCIEEDLSDYDPSIPPSNGHQYLYCVMQEAAQIPNVSVADTSHLRKKPVNTSFIEETLPITSQELIPSTEWQDTQITDFTNLRHSIERRKSSYPENSWQDVSKFGEKDWLKFCFGAVKDIEQKPMMNILLVLNQPRLEKLLNYFIKWLREGTKEFTTSITMWLFSIMACIKTPLTPELCSDLRNLSRLCWSRRAAIESKQDELLAPLCLLICIIGKYFRQHDLSD